MDAAVAALIGAGVGAVVPAAATMFASRGARQEAREARLFDHRREAYAGFLAQARSSLGASAEWYLEGDGRGGREPPEDALVPLYNARAEVSLYGTSETDRLGGDVFDAVSAYTFKKDSPENYTAADDAIARFVARARLDLAVAPK